LGGLTTSDVDTVLQGGVIWQRNLTKN